MQVLCPFFDGVVWGFLILSCMSCLCILEIKPFLVASFANIFFPVCKLSFCFAYGFLCFAKVYKFDQVLFVYFSFYFFHLQRLTKENTTMIDVRECLFSSKSIMVSFIFRSLSYFEFIFMYGVREYSNFIDLYTVVQFSQNHLVKRLFFLQSVFLPPLLKINLLQVCGFIYGLSITFH